MKNNIKYIILIALVFIGGIFSGYLLFKSDDRKDQSFSEHNDLHQVTAEIWTCSMHPQIKQPEPGQCPICGMDLIPLGQSSDNNPVTLTMTDEAIRLANIQTSTVGNVGKYDSSEDTWLINGKILPDERQIYAQTPHISGRIESLAVTYEGMYVTKGSQIAELYSPEIISAQRELLEAQKLRDVNPGILEAARKKLKYLKISEEFVSNLEKKGEIVETFPLRAGKSGYVLNKNVDIGDHVTAGEVLFDIYNLGSVWAVLDVYEKDIGKISKGDVISFTAPAVPDRTFRTRVDFINPILDQETRAIRVRGQVNNRDAILKPQMLIRGQMETDDSENDTNLWVPKTAVLWTGRNSVVYVKDTTVDVPTFAFREVTLGDETGHSYMVLRGLSSGEEVVTNGVFSVDASAQLNNQRSMMNRMVEVPGDEDHIQMIRQVDPEIVTDGAEMDLDQVLYGYIQLKNDLVTGEPDQIRLDLEKLNNASRNLNDRKDLGTYNEAWNTQLKNFGRHLKIMMEHSDVKGWREAFVPLSSALIRWIREFGNPDDNLLYVQHCPMADNEQGADWISLDLDIRNPYFGEQMMTCGSTQDTLMHH